MNKKLILKYILMYLPFVVGIVMFSTGLINIFSSLLLFLGGYVAIKNTFDYRKVRKNMNVSRVEKDTELMETSIRQNDVSSKVYIKPKKAEDIVGFKRTRRYGRVRRMR